MDLETKIVEIARTLVKRKSINGLNDRGISQKFEVSESDAKKVRNLIKAFNLENQEAEGIPQQWYSAISLVNKYFLNYVKNREWARIKRTYTELSFEDHELKSWGRWLLARQEVGHLVNLDPLLIQTDLPSDEKKPEKADHKQYVSNKRIWFDEERDTYTTYIPGVPHAIELPGEVHRDLIRAYSNFAGHPASVNELARTFQLPRNWIVKYLRIHEITHDREPFTPEEIMSRSEDELAEEALQIRRAALYTRLERDKWKEIQKDAQRWREYEASTLRRLENITESGGARDIPKLVIPQSKRKYTAVITPTDFHWGKYGDIYECGETYNRPTARERLFSSTEKVLADITKHGKPDKIIIGIGSDFFNADNYNATTTSGTPQDNDGNMSDILTTGCELMTDYIDLLRQVAPVQMVLMAGNHDQLLSVSLHLYLQAWYKNCEEVTTIKSAQHRQYLIYDNNLLCFHHGDGVSKTSDLARLAAIEAKEAWGKCDHKMVFTGHLHHEKIEEDRGFTRYQLPSLSGEDRWHAKKGYIGNRKVIAAVLVDANAGVFASLYAEGNK
tara:strand:- start:763 stop:2436 length:1674 start_codon:yes stop_codon:yes gene_type:complete